MRRQEFGLWSYACDLMSGGVSLAKTHNYGNVRYYSPSWIKEIKDSKVERSVRDSVMKKVGEWCHNSGKKSREFLLTHFRVLFQNNLRFAGNMRNKLDLSESEIKAILQNRSSKYPDVQAISDEIIQASLDNGSDDNCTIVTTFIQPYSRLSGKTRHLTRLCEWN